MSADPNADRLSFEEAKTLARNQDAAVREALATRSDLAPELLFYLGQVLDTAVRRGGPGNGATPPQADLMLTKDAAESVRSTLVPKTAAKIPPNGGDDPGPLEQLTVDILVALSNDLSPSVRGMLSDAIKELEHAPQGVVSTLARDRDLAVAEPVLRHSPQLGDADLVNLVEEETAPGARSVIARRQEVSARLADAIARTDDEEAIGVLLGNKSAQIREDTLDSILERAPGKKRWHKPLVHRPTLPSNAIERLAKFVAMALVHVLQNRPDADEDTLSAVAKIADNRVRAGEMLPSEAFALDPDGEGAEPKGLEKPTTAAGGAEPKGLEAGRAKGPYGGAAQAHLLDDRNKLTVDEIDEALFAGDRAFVVTALALKSGIHEDIVESIMKSQSARGVTALCWKAGLGARMAMKVQTQIGRIPPKSALGPREGGDKFALSTKEMKWQLEFFGAR